MKREIAQNQKGFTLIETLVSIVIFSVSIVALISITAGGVSDTNFARKKQNAYLLAQEGVELVRYMRDSIVRYNAPGGWILFNQGMSDCMLSQSNAGCRIDSFELASGGSFGDALAACGQSCPFMQTEELNPNQLLPPSKGFYQYSYGPKTDFVRTIYLDKVSADELLLVSKVEWMHGGRNYEIVLKEVITSWVRSHPAFQQQ
jgi:prepilin-type N-terminal cleavage/methylation domain-containing protein